MARIRVIRKPSTARRTVVLYCCGVLLFGVAYLLAPWLALRVGTTTYTITVIVALFLLSPALLFALAFSEQRIRPAACEAIGFGLGFLTVILGVFALGMAGRILQDLLAALVVIVVFLAIRLASIWIVRTWFRELIIQTGWLCPTCGYDLRGTPGDRCSECGMKSPQNVRDELAHSE